MSWKQYAVQAEIDKQIQQAKAERTAEIVAIVEEMKQKYETHMEQYPDYKEEYEQACDVCEAIELAVKTRIQGGSDEKLQ